MLRRQIPGSFVTAAPVVFAWMIVGCTPPPVYPNCQNDGQCHQAEFCVNGTCQQCRPGMNDCRRGYNCVSGRCEPIPGWCDSDADCPEGQECVNNRCVARQVTAPDVTPGPCQLAPVYFAYDSSELDGSARSTLQTNIQCMNSRDIATVRITGHADPRGTEEYNLALGDRRARSAAGFLNNGGIDRSRVTTRSVGEEMASGRDEASWARDRRAEFEENAGGGGSRRR